MSKLFRPDGEAILLNVQELPLVNTILNKKAHFLRVVLQQYHSIKSRHC